MLPMTGAPEGPRWIGVPDTNTAGPPADRIVPPRENAVGFAVKVWLPTVKIDEWG